MKAFSLEEYLQNPSRKVVTGDGRSVKIHCTNYVNVYPVIAEIEGSGESHSYTKDGALLLDVDSSDDLFFTPEKHEGWVNIYKAGAQRETLGCFVTRYVGSSIWPTEEAAKAAADPDPIATIKIEWEE